MTKSFRNGDFKLLEDVPFKDTFGSPRRKRFTAYMLECLLNLPTNSLTEKIKVLRDKTLEKYSFDDKEFQADIIVMYEGNYYNFEAFTYFGKVGLVKSQGYRGRVFSTQLQRGDEYKSTKKVIQYIIADKVDMNISEDMITKNVFSKNSVVLSEYQEINIIRLDKLEDIKYNEGISDKKLLRLLKYLKANNQKSRDRIAREDEELMKINQFVKRFMKNKNAEEKYNRNSFQAQQKIEEGISIGKSLGHQIGKEEGITIGNRKFAKYLQESGKSLKEISDTLELPVSEIQKLLN